MATTVLKDTMLWCLIEIASSMQQVSPIQSLITLPKIEKPSIPKIEEVLALLLYIQAKNTLQLPKWGPIPIYTYMNTLLSDYTESSEKAPNAPTLP